MGNESNNQEQGQSTMLGAPRHPAPSDPIRALREARIRATVGSSSRNCQAVLEATGIGDLFPFPGVSCAFSNLVNWDFVPNKL